MALTNNSLTKYLLLSYSFLSFVIPEYSLGQASCQELFNPSKFYKKVSYYRKKQSLEKPIHFQFHSYRYSKPSIYTVDIKLGAGASEVYLTKDRSKVIKRFRTPSGLYLYEVLMSEFLIELGQAVPAILDYSSNILSPKGKDVFLVKQYIPGLNRNERKTLGIKDNQPELNLQKENYKEITKDFKKWVKRHPYKKSYQKVSSDWVRIGDYNKNANWILTEKGWVLIDP